MKRFKLKNMSSVIKENILIYREEIERPLPKAPFQIILFTPHQIKLHLINSSNFTPNICNQMSLQNLAF